MIPDVVTEWHRQHSCVASLQSSEPSIITVRMTCWVNGSCCSELRHHSHTWRNVNDVNVLSTAVDSCLCCSVPTDQITFIQDVGQMSLRRFSSRYHTLSFTVKQHRMSLLSLHSCRGAGRTGVIGLRVGWLFSFTSCLVLVAVLSFVSWNMSVGWTWCACFISSVWLQQAEVIITVIRPKNKCFCCFNKVTTSSDRTVIMPTELCVFYYSCCSVHICYCYKCTCFKSFLLLSL